MISPNSKQGLVVALDATIKRAEKAEARVKQLETLVGAWKIRRTSDGGYALIQPDGQATGIVYLGLDAFTKAEREAATRNASRAVERSKPEDSQSRSAGE